MRRTLSAGVGLLLLLLAPGPAVGQAEKSTDVSGDWEVTAETPFGNFTSTMKLEKQGEALSGRFIGEDDRESKLDKLKLAGNTISFERDITVNGLDLHLVYTGVVDGDSMKGTFTAGDQAMNWTAKRKTAVAGAAGTGSVAGTWKIQMETPGGTRERTLVLKQEGDRATGTLTGRDDEAIPLEGVSLKGRELRFTLTQERNGNTFRRTYVATVDGDTLKGTIEGGNRELSFTGKRQAAPAAAPVVAAPVFAGAWKLVVQADQTYRPTLHLTEQDGKLTGKLVGDDGGEWPLKEVVTKGNQLDFAVDIDVDGQQLHLKFSGTIDGNGLKGAFSQGDASYTTTGERQPKT